MIHTGFIAPKTTQSGAITLGSYSLAPDGNMRVI